MAGGTQWLGNGLCLLPKWRVTFLAVTDHPELGWKTIELNSLTVRGQKPEIPVPAGLVPSGGSKGESVAASPLASGGCLQTLVSDVWVHHASLCLCCHVACSLRGALFRVQISLFYKDTSP